MALNAHTHSWPLVDMLLIGQMMIININNPVLFIIVFLYLLLDTSVNLEV